MKAFYRLAGDLEGPDTPDHPEYYNRGAGEALPVSASQGLGASFRLAEYETAYEARSRLKELDQANQGERLSVVELNRRYPGIERPFTAPTSAAAADLIAKEQSRRRELQYLASKGPNSWLYKAGQLGASALAHALDPYETGANLALGFLMGGPAGSLANVAARSLAAGAIVGAGSEAAVYKAERAYQYDYSIKDALANVAISTVAGAAIETGAAAAFRAFSRAPKAAELAEKLAVAQAAQGKRVDVGAILEDLDASNRGSRPYIYDPIDTFDKAKARSYFVGSERDFGDFRATPKPTYQSNLGPGLLHVTDNPNLAYARAGQKTSAVGGPVFEAKITRDVNLINLEKKFAQGPVREVVRSYLQRALGKNVGKNFADEIMDGASGREVIELIADALRDNELKGRKGMSLDVGRGDLPVEDVLGDLYRDLNRAGFDGFRYEAGRPVGADPTIRDTYVDPATGEIRVAEPVGAVDSRANDVALFDFERTGDASGLLESVSKTMADPAQTPGLSRQRIRDIAERQMSAESDDTFDRTVADGMTRFDEEMPPPDATVLSEEVAEYKKRIKDWEDLDMAPEGFEADLQALKDGEALDALKERIAVQAMSCLGGAA